MTTLAVLLIIGSAVVGPIEAPSDSLTLPEACAWAKEQAGFRLAVAGQKADGTFYAPTTWTTQRGLKVATMEAYWKNQDGSEYYFNDVRCVPVPTGYRK